MLFLSSLFVVSGCVASGYIAQSNPSELAVFVSKVSPRTVTVGSVRGYSPREGDCPASVVKALVLLKSKAYPETATLAVPLLLLPKTPPSQ